MIVNLQRPGEHPYCGPNTLDILSGYSYTPSLFSTEGINVKLCGWKDMDVPDSLYFMLDIVKEMIYEVKHEKKRVLVHCHAGKGRTGVVIACYLMFKYHIKADEAVNKVREKRPKCIESKSQMEYCKRFFQFISGLREIFCKEKKDVYTFIKHQNDLILKNYHNQNNYDKERSFIPLMILITLNLLLKLRKKNLCENIDIYKSLNGSCDLNDEIYANIQNITIEINKGNWKVLKKCKDPVLIGELLFIWMDDCIYNCVNPATVDEAIYDEIEFNESESKNDINNINDNNNNNDNNINNNNNNENNNNNKKEKIFNLLIDYKNINQNLIEKIYDFFQNKFKKYEWEILKFFAIFLKETFPNSNNKSDRFSSKTPTNKIENNNIISDILIINENIKEEDENSNPDFSQVKIEEEKQYRLMLEKIAIFLLGYDIDLLFDNQSMSIVNINNNNNNNISNNNNINISYNNNNISNNNNLSLSAFEKPNSFLKSVKNTILLLKFLRDTLTLENYGFFETELYYIKSPTNKNKIVGNLKTFKDYSEHYKNFHRTSTLSNNSCISNFTNNNINFSPFHRNEIIHNNNNNNNDLKNSIAHSNSTNFILNLNQKNMSPLSIKKESEINKNYEKKLFEIYKILKLHFENNLSWSKIGYKNYENIYNNLDFSESENNNVSLFNNKKNKQIKNLLTNSLNESSKIAFKIQVMSCEKEDEKNSQNLKNSINKNIKFIENNYSFNNNYNGNNFNNNNNDFNNNDINNNDNNFINNTNINNNDMNDFNSQIFRKKIHSKSNQIPKIELNENEIFFEKIKNDEAHVSFYCPEKKKSNFLNGNNNSLIFRNNKKRSTIILKNLFNTNVISDNKNNNIQLSNRNVKEFKKHKSNQIKMKKQNSNKIMNTTSK